MKKVILSIDGMTCSACSNGLEKYLNKQKGIDEVSVNLVLANASICYDEDVLQMKDIEQYIEKAGFKSLGIFEDISFEKENLQERRNLLIFSCLFLIFMYVSMGHMIHLPIVSYLSLYRNPFGYVLFLFVFTILFLIYGVDILKNGYKNFIHKTSNMDTLVTLGVVTSFLYSFYEMVLVLEGDISRIHNLYFESVVSVLYFVKLGRYLDFVHKDKTKEAIRKLVEITPNKALLKRGKREEVVTLDMVQVGDILISKPGDRIAVDGVITSGEAHFDEAFITGESRPASKRMGDLVVAGSLNYDGYIEYQAEKIGKESTISEIVQLVMEASSTKIPIAKIVDQVSYYFVPAVLIISILTLFGYLILGFSFQEAFLSFLSVLVIACPCSLGLATPLAMMVSEGRSIQKGILIKKSEVLETARHVDTVVFDKTGTLTYGKPRIAQVINYSNLSDEEVLLLAGSLEHQVNHPIGKAFQKYLENHKLAPLEVSNFENISGFGVTGVVDNQNIILGNAKLLKKHHISNSRSADERCLSKEGCSVVYIVCNLKVIALVGIRDVIREGVKNTISQFQKRGIDVVMLSGDNQDTAEKLAREIGIDKVLSDVLPNEKEAFIQKLQKDGHFVLMCGDGINDSPSLAVSDIGVSVHTGSDIAMNSSDVVLLHSNLQGILELLDISEKTVRNIHQNLFWAFFYNTMMIPVAIGFFKPYGVSITPMLASIFMIFSSMTVVLNALRLRK